MKPRDNFVREREDDDEDGEVLVTKRIVLVSHGAEDKRLINSKRPL